MTETKPKRRWFRFGLHRLFGLATIIGVSAAFVLWQVVPGHASNSQFAVLNRLSQEINAKYGFMDGTPRVNCGPCIRFAVALRDRWNGRFSTKVTFGCLVAKSQCGHIAIRLPDGSFFDGGNGVMTQGKLATMYSDCTLEEMSELDAKLFGSQDLELLHEQISEHSGRYPECPNYSDDSTAKLIDKYLALLPTG